VTRLGRAALLVMAAAAVRPAQAQVLSCQAVFGDRGTTAAFARAGAGVTQALSAAGAASDEAAQQVERCLAAEMAGAPEPEACRRAGALLRDARAGLDALPAALERLQAVARQDRTLPVFDDALARILADGGGRLARVRTLAEILEAQRADLAPLRAAFDASGEAFVSSLPEAEKGRLAAAVYAERAPLLARVLEATERLEAYRRFHFDTCRATAAALRQVHPAGLQWLEEPR
jgi:hypothetical protein